MRKRLLSLLLCILLLWLLSVPAVADHFEGKEGWTVEFTEREYMEINFSTWEYDDPVAGLQPGDDITFTVTLLNSNRQTVDWYMTNKVLHSLEDRSKTAAGGAYSYLLTYIAQDGTERVLFDSNTVGGDFVDEVDEGLHQATNALEDYFYLDTIASGQTGMVTLNVALDGETQGNDYQLTLGDLQMNFAVELEVSHPNTDRTVVKTGDESKVVAYFLASSISGFAVLVLAFSLLRWQRKERGEGQL